MAKSAIKATAPVRKKGQHKVEHPLESKRNAAALAVFGCFTGVGITMIDPRFKVGATLCVIGLFGTIWLYRTALNAIRLFKLNTWPKIAIFMILLQIVLPIIVIVMHLSEEKSAKITERDLQKIRNIPGIKPEICSTISIKNSEFFHGNNGIVINGAGCTNLKLDGFKAHDMSGSIIDRRP
jgi:hypothetical protein